MNLLRSFVTNIIHQKIKKCNRCWENKTCHILKKRIVSRIGFENSFPMRFFILTPTVIVGVNFYNTDTAELKQKERRKSHGRCTDRFGEA